MIIIRYWRHTGSSASWCPICGDCICPRSIEDACEPAEIAWGERPWIGALQPMARVHHPECPLHRVGSEHEDGAVPGVARARESVRG